MQDMQTLEIVGQTDQGPLASEVDQTPKGELAEAQHLLDDANDRFNRRLAQAIEAIADVGAELVGHYFYGGSILGWRLRFLSKERAPTLMMRVTRSPPPCESANPQAAGSGIGGGAFPLRRSAITSAMYGQGETRR